MPKTRGNIPSLTPFTTDREEPLTSHIGFKATASFKAKLKQKENWQEFVRETLAKALEAESA